VKKVVITGGAGFIGTNLVTSLLERGDTHIVLYDNLSRFGSGKNLAYLRDQGTSCLEAIVGDVRDYRRLKEAMKGADIVYHLAAQVAVTTSVNDPRKDFEVNASGTLNMLEAARQVGNNPIVLYASTNKVYGSMENIPIKQVGDRYEYIPPRVGISEQQPLDFHSPYGCSKGTGDQYARDYCRIYGMSTVVFRQSCIYGPRQFGMADQGWLAWLATAAYKDLPIAIYGDGKQVRDILYVDDLLQAFNQAIGSIEVTRGQVYNIGGGPQNTLSLLDWIQLLETHLSRQIHYGFAEWRPGDQRVYISDIAKAERDFGWRPHVPKAMGIAKLLQWIESEQ